MHKMRPQGSEHYFWQLVLLQQWQKDQFSFIPLFSCYETYIIILPEVNWIHENFVPIYSESLKEKPKILFYNMFSSIKIGQYSSILASVHASIFWVNLVAKNVVIRSLGTQLWALSAVWCLSFSRNRKMFWTRLLDYDNFLVKRCTSLIYVKEKSFVWAIFHKLSLNHFLVYAYKLFCCIFIFYFSFWHKFHNYWKI